MQTESRRKVSELCFICGKVLDKVTECAWTSCPKWLEEEKLKDAEMSGGEAVNNDS